MTSLPGPSSQSMDLAAKVFLVVQFSGVFVTVTHGIRFEEGAIWIRHRRREFGPFDYEWSKDYLGVELTFEGQKCGEFCSTSEYFVDLEPYGLPRTVVRVATIAMACLVESLRQGLTRPEREQLVFQQLARFGFARFERLEQNSP